MKAKKGSVEVLNQELRTELTAAHQYLLHGAMCMNWEYERLDDHPAISPSRRLVIRQT